MRFCTKNGEIDQTAWMKAYMDITGVTESEARSVYMYVGCNDTVSTEGECSAKNDLTMVSSDVHADQTKYRVSPDLREVSGLPKGS